MELEDDFIDGNFEFPLENEPTAEQEERPTPKATKKCTALADIDTNIEPAGEKPRKRKNRGNKEKESNTPQETGVILQLEEFDEEQKTTQANEMCKDLKLIVNTVTKKGAVYASISKKLPRSDGEGNTIHGKED